jgi:hypothetical protein
VGSEESHLQESLEEALVERETVSLVVVEGTDILVDEEISVDINSPFTFDVSHFLPNVVPLTLPAFFETVSQVMSDAQEREGVDEDRRVSLIEEYPPDAFGHDEDERICFRVLSRQPANMNQKGTGRPQRGFRAYYDVIQARDPNKVLAIESRPVDHTIEFTCWAKSNKLANARALWLENLLTNHSWAFQIKGAERFWWEKRGADGYMTSGGQRLFYRPLNFFLRFREFAVRAAPVIRNFEIRYGLQNYLLNTSTYEED